MHCTNNMLVSFRERITMDVLVDMTHEDLQSIGVTAFGDRHRILRSVKELAHSGGAGEPWGGGGGSLST